MTSTVSSVSNGHVPPKKLSSVLLPPLHVPPGQAVVPFGMVFEPEKVPSFSLFSVPGQLSFIHTNPVELDSFHGQSRQPETFWVTPAVEPATGNLAFKTSVSPFSHPLSSVGTHASPHTPACSENSFVKNLMWGQIISLPLAVLAIFGGPLAGMHLDASGIPKKVQEMELYDKLPLVGGHGITKLTGVHADELYCEESEHGHNSHTADPHSQESPEEHAAHAHEAFSANAEQLKEKLCQNKTSWGRHVGNEVQMEGFRALGIAAYFFGPGSLIHLFRGRKKKPVATSETVS